MTFMADLKDGLNDPRRRYGIIYRLLVFPITITLLLTAAILFGVAHLIAYGEWESIK